jgi:hypothetical protein
MTNETATLAICDCRLRLPSLRGTKQSGNELSIDIVQYTITIIARKLLNKFSNFLAITTAHRLLTRLCIKTQHF